MQDTTHKDPTPSDPSIAGSIGFFLNDLASKSFTVPAYTDISLPASATTVTVNIDAGKVKPYP